MSFITKSIFLLVFFTKGSNVNPEDLETETDRFYSMVFESITLPQREQEYSLQNNVQPNPGSSFENQPGTSRQPLQEEEQYYSLPNYTDRSLDTQQSKQQVANENDVCNSLSDNTKQLSAVQNAYIQEQDEEEQFIDSLSSSLSDSLPFDCADEASLVNGVSYLPRKRVNIIQSDQRSYFIQNDFKSLNILKSELIPSYVLNPSNKMSQEEINVIEYAIEMIAMKGCLQEFTYEYLTDDNKIIKTQKTITKTDEPTNLALMHTKLATAALKYAFEKAIESEEAKQKLNNDNFSIIWNCCEHAFDVKPVCSATAKSTMNTQTLDKELSYLLYLEYLCIFLEENGTYNSDVNKELSHINLFKQTLEVLRSVHAIPEAELSPLEMIKSEKFKQVYAPMLNSCLQLRINMYNQFITQSSNSIKEKEHDPLKLYLIGSITLDTILLILNIAINYSKLERSTNFTIFNVKFSVSEEMLNLGNNTDFNAGLLLLKNIDKSRFILQIDYDVLPSNLLLMMINNFLDLLFLPITFTPTDN